MIKIKKILSILLVLLLLLFNNVSFAVNKGGWLEVFDKGDAQGILEDYINQYSVCSAKDMKCEENLQKLGDMLKKGEIGGSEKNTFLTAVVSNISLRLGLGASNSIFKKLVFTPEEEKLIDPAVIDGIKNLRFVELDYEALYKAGQIDAEAYNTFKGGFYDKIIKALGLENIDTKYRGMPKEVQVNGFFALVVPKSNAKAIKILFANGYYKMMEPNTIAFSLPGELVFFGIPDRGTLVNGGIGSISSANNDGLNYLIAGKIKYPKELKQCFSDETKYRDVIDIGQLDKYLQDECNLLYPVYLDIDNIHEFIGGFNAGAVNEFTAVFALDEKNGFLYIIPVKRFFKRQIALLLPSSDHTGNKGYNVLVKDNTAIQDFESNISAPDKNARRILFSDRLQGISLDVTDNSYCEYDNTKKRIIVKDKGSNITNNIVNCKLKIGINTTKLSWLRNNDQLSSLMISIAGSGEKETKSDLYLGMGVGNNVDDIKKAGIHHIGEYTIDKGFNSKDIGFNILKKKVETNEFLPYYSKVYFNTYLDPDDGKKVVQCNIDGTKIYDEKINGHNNSTTEYEIIAGGMKSVGGVSNFDENTFGLKDTLYFTVSGDKDIYIDHIEYAVPDSNKYYLYKIYNKKTTEDATDAGYKTLVLIQTLNFEGYRYFNKDIGMGDNNYVNGDSTEGILIEFSGMNNPLTLYKSPINKHYSISNITDIDFDVVKYEYGKNGFGKFRATKHYKYVYDKDNDKYSIEKTDYLLKNGVDVQGVGLGGFVGKLLKNCGLENFVNNTLDDCSTLIPLDTDYDKVSLDGKNGTYKDWKEWVYVTNNRIIIFNNKTVKTTLGDYDVDIGTMLDIGGVTYCSKVNQELDYYNGHLDKNHAFNEDGTNSWGYGTDKDGDGKADGVSLILKKGDDKLIFVLGGTSFYNKRYKLNQIINDPDNMINCDE